MNENNELENVRNLGKDTHKYFSNHLNELSKKDKYISLKKDSIAEVLDHLISGVINLAIEFEKKITLSEDKKEQYKKFILKKYIPTTYKIYDNEKKLIQSVADIFQSFETKINDQELVNFLIDFIDAFHIKELILNNYIYYNHLFNDRELTIKNFIEHLEIFPRSRINEAAIDGNHKGGYLEISGFDFNLQDELISKFLNLKIDNDNLLIMLIRYRIACENWLYHCQILNNLWNILKNDGDPSTRPIDKKLKDPLISNYAWDKHFLDVAKKGLLWGVPRFVLYLLTLFILPIFGLFVSNNTNIIILCWLLIIAFAIQQIYNKLGSKRREEKAKQKLASLSLRDDMFYLSFDVEGKSLHDEEGHFEGLDTEEIIRKIRELRNKHASYPVDLIALLRKEVDKGNYVLRIKRL